MSIQRTRFNFFKVEVYYDEKHMYYFPSNFNSRKLLVILVYDIIYVELFPDLKNFDEKGHILISFSFLSHFMNKTDFVTIHMHIHVSFRYALFVEMSILHKKYLDNAFKLKTK